MLRICSGRSYRNQSIGSKAHPQWKTILVRDKRIDVINSNEFGARKRILAPLEDVPAKKFDYPKSVTRKQFETALKNLKYPIPSEIVDRIFENGEELVILNKIIKVANNKAAEVDYPTLGFTDNNPLLDYYASTYQMVSNIQVDKKVLLTLNILIEILG